VRASATRCNGDCETRAHGIASSYTDAVEEHFRASVLHALPAQYDSIVKQIEDGDEGTSYDMSASAVHTPAQVLSPTPSRSPAHPLPAVPEPNLNSHVFCRVKEDKGNVEIDECARTSATCNSLCTGD